MQRHRAFPKILREEIRWAIDTQEHHFAGKVYFIAEQYDVKLQADNHCPLGCGRKAEP